MRLRYVITAVLIHGTGDPASAQEVGIETYYRHASPHYWHVPDVILPPLRRWELRPDKTGAILMQECNFGDPASAQEVGIETNCGVSVACGHDSSVILPPLRRWELRLIDTRSLAPG